MDGFDVAPVVGEQRADGVGDLETVPAAVQGFTEPGAGQLAPHSRDVNAEGVGGQFDMSGGQLSALRELQ
ncbi:hypothetical protein D9753_00245 (plasmid) [Streptomyces dangxiongensis]|uniref:Uncharacterized protein n=1 Tax=Streptomyces dangxiongensis TaxID=1442032 RepID=A0A3G2J674_9ACTN|nr:hypothetical protein [Streptomyces dangxiongensis]AYN37690.1 hypothetical protein D9753_00245 [Streptomyces dangxiongensis]